MRHSIIIFSFFCILFSSCNLERIVDIGEIPITPQLVFNGLLYADRDTNYFYITESYPIYDNDTSLGLNDYNPEHKLIKNATFSLLVNGKSRIVEYSPSDNAYILLGRLQEKDSITLRIRHQEKEISSKTFLPSAPQVISIDTATFARFDYVNQTECVLFRLKIKDNPNEKNYYRLLVNNQIYYQNEEFSNWYQSNTYYTNDPVLTNGYTGISGNTGMGGTYLMGNFFSVFRDAMFKDKEYTLTFYTVKYPVIIYDTIQCNMSVRLQSISEDLYKYYSSQQQSKTVSSGYLSSVPVIVHNNIDNGLGILGACNEIKIFEGTFSKINARLTKE